VRLLRWPVPDFDGTARSSKLASGIAASGGGFRAMRFHPLPLSELGGDARRWHHQTTFLEVIVVHLSRDHFMLMLNDTISGKLWL
jgi:hypothetical protein